MKLTFASIGLLFAALAVTPSADATVETILDYTIVYHEPQSDDYCYRTMPMRAEIGIPGASVMQAVYTPVQVFNQNGIPSKYVNINLVATQPPMVPSYVSDSIDPDGTMNYSMKVDVTPLAKANGTSTSGRLATIRAAKLGLLSMAKSISRLSGGKFRLRVTFTGLPSQTGLPGLTLPATTTSPYSAASPLLASFEKEWINTGGSCR